MIHSVKVKGEARKFRRRHTIKSEVARYVINLMVCDRRLSVTSTVPEAYSVSRRG